MFNINKAFGKKLIKVVEGSAGSMWRYEVHFSYDNVFYSR